MRSPRTILLLAVVCLLLGGAVSLHNVYIEASGLREPLSFAAGGVRDVTFRPRWERLHFVTLMVDSSAPVPADACLDPQGFPDAQVDLQWELREDGRFVASGRAADARMRIGRARDRTVILGAFEASPRHRYTLHVEVVKGCEALDALSPRVEIGLRPGRPMLAYSMTGHALLIVGAGFLVGFTRRRDKSWPYLQIWRWVERRRG